MDMCKIRCKIVNSQLIVFKKKKGRKSSYMNQYTLIQRLNLLRSLMGSGFEKPGEIFWERFRHVRMILVKYHYVIYITDQP